MRYLVKYNNRLKFDEVRADYKMTLFYVNTLYKRKIAHFL